MVTNTVNMSLPSFDRLPLSQIKREAARKNLKQKDVIVGISRQSVLKNLMTIKENQNGRLLCCVVKADAYGHGLANIVPLIDEQTDAYGITRNDDALKIRKMGITKPIIRLGEPSSEEIRDGIQRKLCIEEMVGSLNKAQEISFELTQAKSNKSMNIHISLNTGDIGRDGFECGRKYELLADFEKICEIENLDIKGIMTHFGYAESADQGVQHTKATQFIEISQWIRRIANKKGHFPLIHMTNTSSFTLFPEKIKKFCDMDRVGRLLYGFYDSNAPGNITKKIRPVMSAVCQEVAMHHRPPNSHIGYCEFYKVARDKGEDIKTLTCGWSRFPTHSLNPLKFMDDRGRDYSVKGLAGMNYTMVTADPTAHKEDDSENGKYYIFVGHSRQSILDIANKTKTIPAFVALTLGNSDPESRLLY